MQQKWQSTPSSVFCRNYSAHALFRTAFWPVSRKPSQTQPGLIDRLSSPFCPFSSALVLLWDSSSFSLYVLPNFRLFFLPTFLPTPNLEIAEKLRFFCQKSEFLTEKSGVFQQDLSCSKVFWSKSLGKRAENLSFFRFSPEFVQNTIFLQLWVFG